MASISRRACFKCGLNNHFAADCPSTERLCYNCKQPGHESNACPLPRTTESKQCYSCSGMGHVSADCPTLRLAGNTGRCYNCSQPGHLARDCPNPPGMGRGGPVPRGGFGGFGGRGGFAGPRAIVCNRCGQGNHYARDCLATGTKCYSCGKTDGHISRDCPGPNGGAMNPGVKTCYTCGQATGHIARDCPQRLGNQGTGNIGGGPPLPPMN